MAKKKKRKTAKKATRKTATKRKPAKKATRKKAKKTTRKAAKKATRKKATKRKTTKKATRKKATRKKTAKKATRKKAAKKTKKKGKTKRKPNAAFMKPLTPSKQLAEVIGAKPIPRTQVVKKLWIYIKKHDLQDPKNRRNIVADTKLRAVFGKGTVSMFEMTKIVSKHLK